VVLAAHSWAGAVISHPAIAACGNVTALVYVAAFQPDAGESAGALNAKFPGTLLIPDNLNIAPNPLGGEDLTLRSERFAEVYAADLDPAHAAVMAASQRPIEPAALGEALPGEPACRALPSWALVSTRGLSLCRRRFCASWPSAPDPASSRSNPRTPPRSHSPRPSRT
jgi:pimeloyl-ACP methyl ester carboxylesterase